MEFTYPDATDASGLIGGIRKVVAAYTTDSGGAASGTTKRIVGSLIKGVTDPGDGPTDDWDITITDEEGLNVLAGCQSNLTNRDTTNSEQVYFLLLDAAGTPLAQSLFPVVSDALTITVANGGSTKSGQIILYYRPAG